MRFGVFFGSQAPHRLLSPQQALEQELQQIEMAEQLGFDAVWLAEHHFTDYGAVADALTYAAHVAARTSRIRIGAAVTLPLHHPIEIAERVALADFLSNGRLDVAIGDGCSDQALARFGVPPLERDARFLESLDIMGRLWTDETVDYQGECWALPGVSLFAKPLQQPHPSLYMSSGAPDPIRLAAARGFPMLLGPDFIEPGQLVSLYQQYRELAVRQGRTPEEAAILLDACAVVQTVYVGSTSQEALSAPEPYVTWRHQKAVDLGLLRDGSGPRGMPGALGRLRRMFAGDGATDDAEMTWHDLRGYGLYGTPDEVVEKVERLQEAGAEHIICSFAYGGLPDDKVRASMELFAREVMPRFQEEQAPLVDWPGAAPTS